MAPPRRPGPDDGEDPERANKTQARAPRRPSRGAAPAADEDPEAATSTKVKNRADVARGRRAPAADPERFADTQARVRAPRGELEEDSEYKTGRSYHPDDEEALAGELGSLDGDGLEALEPELGTRTKALAEVPDLDDDASAVIQRDDEEDDANATRAGSPVKLEVIAGPDKGRVKKFKGVRLVIGRTPGVDFQLTDQSVSRRHIELVQDEGVVSLRDLGSGNGTKINGVKLAEKKLEHGDEIALGKTKLRFVDEVAAFKKARELAEQKEAEAKVAAEAEAKAAAEAEAKAAAEAEEAAKKAAEDAAQPKPEGEAGAEGADAGAEGGEGDGKTQARVRRPVRTSRDEPTGPMAKWQALPGKLRLVIVGFSSVLLLLLVVGLALRPGAPPPPDPKKLSAEQKMQDARAAVKAGDYQTAVNLIDEAEKLDPGIDKSKLGAQAREELAYVTALEEARSHVAAKRFEDAKKALERAVRGSVKNEELKLKVRQELETAETAYKKEKIDELINTGEVEAAKAVLNELPLEQQAESATKIAEFERALEEQKRQDELDQRRGAANAAAARKAHREEEIAAAFGTVERKFASGEWDRAASECTRVIDVYATDNDIKARAHQLQADIPAFGRAYDEGMKKYRAGALAQAAKPLHQAYGLLMKMKLTANRYAAELQSKLGESSLAAGKEALIHDDLLGAYTAFKDAVRFDPDDLKGRDGLVQVEAKAEDLFQTAYGMKESDPQSALRKFKIVVQVTEPSSPFHERAKNNIAAMQP